MIVDYHTLKFWQLSKSLTLEIYRVTRGFPDEEKFGLTSQVRRAAISIGSNIAEGCGRDTPADLRRFLAIASGSATEVEFQLELARDLGFLVDATADPLISHVIEVRRMIRGYAKTLA